MISCKRRDSISPVFPRLDIVIFYRARREREREDGMTDARGLSLPRVKRRRSKRLSVPTLLFDFFFSFLKRALCVCVCVYSGGNVIEESVVEIHFPPLRFPSSSSFLTPPVRLLRDYTSAGQREYRVADTFELRPFGRADPRPLALFFYSFFFFIQSPQRSCCAALHICVRVVCVCVCVCTWMPV